MQSTNKSICEHLRREVKELSHTYLPDEAADCLLLLLHFAHKNSFSLFEEATKKHLINKDRKWGKPDNDGVVEHLAEPCKTCGGSGFIDTGPDMLDGVPVGMGGCPCPDCQAKPEASGIQETINNIQEALGDPKAPWYGSDIVAWIGDLIEEYKLRKAEIKGLTEALSKAKKMLEGK